MSDKLPFSITFGTLEARLAAINHIDDEKRTAFQARLKNFHRLRYPVGFKSTKGKISHYTAAQYLEMALAVELTQLGLPPERTTRVLSMNWYPTAMAAKIASRELLAVPQGFSADASDPEPMSMFVFFDPCALAPLTVSLDLNIVPDLDDASDTYFYGGIGILQENLARWTAASSGRLSLVNMTSLIDVLAGWNETHTDQANIEMRLQFFNEIVKWAEATEMRGRDGASEYYISRFLDTHPFERKVALTVEQAADYLSAATGISPDITLAYFIKHGTSALKGGGNDVGS